jgi:hypothetical protein
VEAQKAVALEAIAPEVAAQEAQTLTLEMEGRGAVTPEMVALEAGIQEVVTLVVAAMATITQEAPETATLEAVPPEAAALEMVTREAVALEMVAREAIPLAVAAQEILEEEPPPVMEETAMVRVGQGMMPEMTVLVSYYHEVYCFIARPISHPRNRKQWK